MECSPGRDDLLTRAVTMSPPADGMRMHTCTVAVGFSISDLAPVRTYALASPDLCTISDNARIGRLGGKAAW